MVNILNIILVIVVLSVASLGFGVFKVKESQNVLNALSLGFLKLLGLNQIINSILIYLEFPAYIIHLITLIFLLLGIINFICHFNKLNKPKPAYIVGLGFYLVIMLYYTYDHSLGIESFDTMHYTSMVNESAVADYIGKVDYYSGAERDSFSKLYDFQTYYTLWGSMLYYIQLTMINFFNNPQIHINIFVYGGVFFFSVLTYNLIVEVGKYLKLKISALNGSAVLVALIIFSQQYYHKLLGFFGNTYRTLIIAYLCFEIYKVLKEKIHKENIINIMFMLSALIAVSSTGFPIAVMLVFAFIAYLIKDNGSDMAINIGLVALPIFQFAFYYAGYLILVLGLVFYLFLFSYQKLFNAKIKEIIRKIAMKVIVIIPILMAIISLIFLNDLYFMNRHFFRLHSAYDMVFDYFNFSGQHLLINGLLFSSIIYYLMKSQDRAYKSILIIIIGFINPISYVFVVQFLMGEVYYRAFDLIFNVFNVILFLNFTINHIKINKIVNSILFVVCLIMAIFEYSNTYHHFFIAQENYNKQYKLTDDQLTLVNYLNTELYYADGDRARVISQFIEIKGYVANIEQYIDVFVARNLHHLEPNSVEDELFRVFYPRPHADMEVFDSEVDYSRACEIIIENKIDYVVVDNNQFYLTEDNDYFKFEHHIRDCGGNNLFFNETYSIYKFYWE